MATSGIITMLVAFLSLPGIGHGQLNTNSETINEVVIERGFAPGRYGQVHIRDARSASIVLDALGYSNEMSVDVLGYHSGGLIAVELAASKPKLVRRLLLPGLPFIASQAREHATMVVGAGMSLERAQRLFTEALKSHPNSWWGYRAVFTYDAESQYTIVGRKT